MPATIPESHQDFLEKPYALTLATVNEDGTPQTTILWYIWDGRSLPLAPPADDKKPKISKIIRTYH